jgi:RimJ/RimL family protein N-acetyltransferase
MKDSLRQLIITFARRRMEQVPEHLVIHAPDAWNLDVAFALPGQGVFHLRNLQEGDVPTLLEFARQLGPTAKDLCCPYPWGDPIRLKLAFQAAIARGVDRTDASYLLLHDGQSIGHFYLERVKGNPRSQMHGLAVPSLGVAIADSYQGRGFGGLAVRVLQVVAESLHADAIELTTAQTNEAGWRTYRSAGFEYIGIRRISLDDGITPCRYRDERHMVYVIAPQKREAILGYLARDQ